MSDTLDPRVTCAGWPCQVDYCNLLKYYTINRVLNATYAIIKVQCDHYDFKKETQKEDTSVGKAKLFVLLLIVCLTKPDEDLCEIETLLH